MFTTETFIVNNAQPIVIKKIESGEEKQLRNEHGSLTAHATLDMQLEDKEKQISAGLKSYLKNKNWGRGDTQRCSGVSPSFALRD